MSILDTINEDAARVVALRKELSATERELAANVARALAEGVGRMDIYRHAPDGIKWPLVEAAAKRLKEQQP